MLTCLKGAFKVKIHGERSVVANDGIRYEINQTLIIDTLKAVTLEHEHLD